MGKSTGYTIVLVRTGETDWDASGRLMGGTDLPMNAEGESAFRQAVGALHESNDAPSLSAILTAPEEAAQKAASILGYGQSAKVRELDGLVNVGLGLWEGVLASELEDRCKTAYREWTDAPMRITPPGGESMHDAQDRLVSTLVKGLRKVKGEHPVVGVVVRPMAWALLRAWMVDHEVGDLWEALRLPIECETIELSAQRAEDGAKRVRATA